MRIQAPALAASTALCTVENTVVPGGHGFVLPLQTSSTLLPLWLAPASTGAPAARAWLPAITGPPPIVSAHATPISHHRLIMGSPVSRTRVAVTAAVRTLAR